MNRPVPDRGRGFGGRLRALRRRAGLSQADLGARIGVAQTTVANYERGLRFPDEATLLEIADFFDASLDYLLGRADRLPPAPAGGPADAGTAGAPAGPATDPLELQRRYLDALLEGRQEAAVEMILSAARSGADLPTLYLRVLQPAMHLVGDLWQAGRVDVAQEHLASSATEAVLARLQPLVASRPADGPAALVAAAYGDLHTLGARMVGDFLRREGWRVHHLGALVPTRSLLQALRRRDAELLALSVTLPEYLETAAAAIRAVRSELEWAVKVLVGGAAFRIEPDAWRRIGADAWAEDAAAAAVEARRLRG